MSPSSVLSVRLSKQQEDVSDPTAKGYGGQQYVKKLHCCNRNASEHYHAKLQTYKISSSYSLMLCTLHVYPVKIVLIGCIPHLVESLLVSLKHVPHVEVQGVGCVPVLQLLEVGVLCESHDVQRGLLCSAVLNLPG